MNSPKLVFASGWAMGDWFWEPLRSSLSDWELEAFGGVPGKPWVGVGHSLGFRKMAESDLTNCQGLVSLSGFWDFCSEGGTPKRVVRRMVRQFARNPGQVLNEFWKNCGFDQEFREPNEVGKLSHELESLLNEFEYVEQEISVWKGIQVFAIAGRQDKIVPRELTQRQFANVIFHPDAGHSLGFDFPEWCAERIRQFLDSL